MWSPDARTMEYATYILSFFFYIALFTTLGTYFFVFYYCTLHINVYWLMYIYMETVCGTPVFYGFGVYWINVFAELLAFYFLCIHNKQKLSYHIYISIYRLVLYNIHTLTYIGVFCMYDWKFTHLLFNRFHLYRLLKKDRKIVSIIYGRIDKLIAFWQ